MKRILGLDIGTNSIGWALVDGDSNKLVDFGVRIFPTELNKERAEKRKNRRTAKRHFSKSIYELAVDKLTTRTSIISWTFCFLTISLFILTITNK